MDWVSAICFLILGVFGGIILMGVLLTFQERSQERREIDARLYEQVKREAVVWRCWVCGNFFESEERPRPLCLCNGCLAKYKERVA